MEVKLIKDFGENMIRITINIVSTSQTLPEFIDEIYPSLETNYNDLEFITNRAILTPKNADVDDLNDISLSKMPGNMYHLQGVDTVSNEDDESLYPLEFLHSCIHQERHLLYCN